MKTISFKLDSELIKKIKIKAEEKGITESELVTTYLINGLKQDENITVSDISELEKKLNINIENKLDAIDFEIPDMLKYNPEKESKPITDELVLLENDKPDGEDIFTEVMGIVSSPHKTNSVELKKETYNS